MQNLEKNLKKSLTHSPKEDVRISPKGKRLYFYKRDKSNKKWEYVSRSQREFIKKLAQKKYNRAQLANVQAELKAINYYLKHAPLETYEEFYQELHPDMKELITPLFKTFDQMIQKYIVSSGLNEDFPPKSSSTTNNNEIVRSKSEGMIANALLAAGIPYAYEPRIEISKGRYLYPDFVCANLVRKKIIYWEHLGMIDDPEYVERQLEKQKQYYKVGLVFGDNLFYTFETASNPLQTSDITHFIEQYLLK